MGECYTNVKSIHKDAFLVSSEVTLHPYITAVKVTLELQSQYVLLSLVQQFFINYSIFIKLRYFHVALVNIKLICTFPSG